MKNNLSLTDKDLIEKISVNNPLNSINKALLNGTNRQRKCYKRTYIE